MYAVLIMSCLHVAVQCYMLLPNAWAYCSCCLTNSANMLPPAFKCGHKLQVALAAIAVCCQKPAVCYKNANHCTCKWLANDADSKMLVEIDC